MNSASLCSLAGRYENPIPPRCLAPLDFLKIPALDAARDTVVATIGSVTNDYPLDMKLKSPSQE
jgi:hypothetical protein